MGKSTISTGQFSIANCKLVYQRVSYGHIMSYQFKSDGFPGFRIYGLINYPYAPCMVYGIFTYIWVIFMVNVGKYSIHGAYMGYSTQEKWDNPRTHHHPTGFLGKIHCRQGTQRVFGRSTTYPSSPPRKQQMLQTCQTSMAGILWL